MVNIILLIALVSSLIIQAHQHRYTRDLEYTIEMLVNDKIDFIITEKEDKEE